MKYLFKFLALCKKTRHNTVVLIFIHTYTIRYVWLVRTYLIRADMTQHVYKSLAFIQLNSTYKVWMKNSRQGTDALIVSDFAPLFFPYLQCWDSSILPSVWILYKFRVYLSNSLFISFQNSFRMFVTCT